MTKNKILSVTVVAFLFSFSSAFAQSKPWPVPKDALLIKNPYAIDEGAVKSGKLLYVKYCVTCHGEKGKGNGIAAAALNPKPADHTSAALQAEPDGSLFYKVTNGRTPMPQFKTTLTDAQRWTLISYIRTLAAKPR